MYNFLAINTISSIVLVLIFLFISFFCLFLFVENHKLREKIKGLEVENKRLLEIKISKQKNIDSIPINKISTSDKKTTHQNNKKIELVQKTIPKEQPKEKVEKKLYQKNVFHEKPNITSPVSLTKIENDNFELNDFIKNNELKIDTNKKKLTNDEINKKIILKDEKKEPNINKIEHSKITDSKINNNIEYLQEISNKIAEELKPQTIELTDYEKLQEENAIISYKELITLKDTIMMLDDEDETINFIEELKRLRNSLK